MSMLSSEELDVIVRETRYTREQRLRRSRIPAQFWNTTFDDYEMDTAAQQDLRAEVAGWVASFRKEPVMHGGRGYLFAGRPGVGKTMLASIIGTSLLDQGHYVRFLRLPTLIEMTLRQFTLQQAWQRYEDPSAHEEWQATDAWLEDAKRLSHLLILDDVGREHQGRSGFAASVFDSLLRTRVDLGRPVLLASNLAMKDWAEEYDHTMQSFVHQACAVREFSGLPDRRLEIEDPR